MKRNTINSENSIKQEKRIDPASRGLAFFATPGLGFVLGLDLYLNVSFGLHLGPGLGLEQHQVPLTKCRVTTKQKDEKDGDPSS